MIKILQAIVFSTMISFLVFWVFFWMGLGIGFDVGHCFAASWKIALVPFPIAFLGYFGGKL